MVFDAPRNRLWMFGGDLQRSRPEGEDPRFTDETWEFTFCPPAWRRVQFSTFNLPNKRGGHAVAHDEVGARVFVVFGRDRSDGTGGVPVPERAFELQSDVWAYDLGTDAWSRLRIAAGDAPAPRHGHTVVWDSSADRLVLFGGVKTGVHVGGCTELPCDALMADTWFLEFGDGQPAWRRLDTEQTPPRRQDHAAVVDGATGTMVVAGGAYGRDAYLDDLWTLDLATGAWLEVVPQGATITPQRALASFAYHPQSRAMLLFGGLGADGLHNDALIIDLEQLIWVRLADDDPRPESGRPPLRAEAALVHVADDRFALFGGEAETNVLGDLWEFDASDRTWQTLAP